MMRTCSYLFLLIALHLTSVNAQIFERVAPKEPDVDRLPAPSAPAASVPELDSDQKILLSALKGVVFHASPAALMASATSEQAIQVPAGSDIMNLPAFTAVVMPYIGEPVSLRSLSRLRRDIVLFYREQDRPIVDLILPEQDITTGVIQLVVVEAVLGKVQVVENQHFSEDYILRNFQRSPGQAIYGSEVLRDLDWLNRNPFMTVRSVFSPGEDAFSSDLILRVNDRAPYRFYTGYENSGNELTGENRFLLGANFGNLFNQGHLLNYQFTMGDDLDEFSAHSFSYRIPFDSKAQVDVYGGFVSTEAETGPFTIEGESIELGARYTHYFQLQPRLSQGLFGGLAWKSSDNGLEFGLEFTSQNKSQVAQLEAGYLLTHRRADSILDLNTSLIFSPGGIVSDADDSDYEAFREGAESQYGYLKLHLNWLKRLPLNLSYQSDIRGQLASGPLLASEQISLGGYNSVRGYEEREFNQTDSGIIWRNEFSLPPLRFDLATGIQSALQFLVFSDYGFGTAESGVIIRPDGSTTESDEMWSIGAGLRLSVNRNFTLRADYGHQLLESTTGEDGMLHLSAILSY